MGGTKKDFETVKGILYTSYTANEHYTEDSLIDWIIKYGSELTKQELKLILIWAEHKEIEAQRNNLKPFSWKNRKPKRTLERAEEYHEEILRSSRRELKWAKEGYDWEFEDEHSLKWQFLELVSSVELDIEGRQLHHCVASYDHNCYSGITSIVSLRVDDMSKLTIEIDLNSKRIMQVRGNSNRLPTEEEKAVISVWIKEKGINVIRY